MQRLEKFSELFNHAFYRKKVQKLTQMEMLFCIGFINANQDLDRAAFKNKAHKIFITGPQVYNFGGVEFRKNNLQNVGFIAEVLISCACVEEVA